MKRENRARLEVPSVSIERDESIESRAEKRPLTCRLHYRQTIYLPFLDYMYLLRDLDDRFLQHTEQISGLACLLPANLTEASIDHEKVADCLHFYEKILPDQSGVAAELKLWCAKWNDCGNSPAIVEPLMEKSCKL